MEDNRGACRASSPDWLFRTSSMKTSSVRQASQGREKSEFSTTEQPCRNPHASPQPSRRRPTSPRRSPERIHLRYGLLSMPKSTTMPVRRHAAQWDEEPLVSGSDGIWRDLRSITDDIKPDFLSGGSKAWRSGPASCDRRLAK